MVPMADILAVSLEGVIIAARRVINKINKTLCLDHVLAEVVQ